MPGRPISDQYGKNADWVDSYVDTRDIKSTSLYLPNGYNINLTPQAGNDGCSNTGVLDFTACRHSRPWRFYGETIKKDFAYNFDNFFNGIFFNDFDPIGETVGMGYPLSVEQGNIISNLSQQYQRDKECYIYGSSCQDTPPPPLGIKIYTVGNASGMVGDQSGIAQCVNGGQLIPCNQIGLTTGATLNNCHGQISSSASC